MNNTDQAFVKAYSKQTSAPHETSRTPSDTAHIVTNDGGSQHRVETGHPIPRPHTTPAGLPAHPEPTTGVEQGGGVADAPGTVDFWAGAEPIVVEMGWNPLPTPAQAAQNHGQTETERRNERASSVTFDEPPLAEPQPESQPTAPPAAKVEAAKAIANPIVDTAPAVEPPPTSRVAEPPPAPTRSFQAVWEVDQFAWEETIDLITNALRGELRQVGRHLARTATQGLHVMALAGLKPRAGTTTVAIQLAQAAAAQELKVAVVDVNYDSPGLCDALGVDVEQGWDDAIANGLSLEEAAIQSLNDEITLLPLAPLAGRARQGARQQLGRLLHEVSDVFDLILLDTGSAELFAEGLERDYPVDQIDAAIVVCDSADAQGADMGSQIDRIRAAGISQIGLIENRCKA